MVTLNAGNSVAAGAAPLLRVLEGTRADVVLIQELTKSINALDGTIADLERDWVLHMGRPVAGAVLTAIMVRRESIRLGVLMPAAAPTATDCGRCLRLPVAWAGGRMALVCTYLPAGDGAGMATLIRTQLKKWAAADANGNLPVGGGRLQLHSHGR